VLLAGQNLVLIEVVEVRELHERGCKTRSQHCFAASTRLPTFRVELKQLTSAAMAGRGGGYALVGLSLQHQLVCL
jgi:hypothetical protein